MPGCRSRADAGPWSGNHGWVLLGIPLSDSCHEVSESKLELLQCFAKVLTDHVVNGLDMFEQFGWQQLVANWPWSVSPVIEVFGIKGHGMLGLAVKGIKA